MLQLHLVLLLPSRIFLKDDEALKNVRERNILFGGEL